MDIPACYINEIFLSIQGEGVLAGFTTLFVRFQGCHMGCRWCDTRLSWKASQKFRWKSVEVVEHIKDTLKDRKTTWVCFTGGEPLEQLESLRWIIEKCHVHEIYNLSLETCGLPAPDKIDLTDMLNRNVFFSVSPKLPSAIGKRYSPAETLRMMRAWDDAVYIKYKLQYKFVVSGAEDVDALNVLFSGPEKFSTEHHLFLQMENKALMDTRFVRKCQDFVDAHDQFRLTVQQHKVLRVR